MKHFGRATKLKMPRKCCVPFCRSNYNSQKEYTSVFSFPKDEPRRTDWIKSINFKNFAPNQNAVICIRHFAELCIIREDRVTRDDGSELIVARQRPTLSKEAYPTIFPEQLSYLTAISPKKRNIPSERNNELPDDEKEQFKKSYIGDVINSLMFEDKLPSYPTPGWLSICEKEIIKNCTYTLPVFLCLKQSRLPTGGYGIWSLENIPIGTRFGPHQDVFIERNKQKKREFEYQVDTKGKDVMIGDERESNWLLYVNYARNEMEQNLIISYNKSGVFYVSCKFIPANTELLVWYQDGIVEDEKGFNVNNIENRENVQRIALAMDCVGRDESKRKHTMAVNDFSHIVSNKELQSMRTFNLNIWKKKTVLVTNKSFRPNYNKPIISMNKEQFSNTKCKEINYNGASKFIDRCQPKSSVYFVKFVFGKALQLEEVGSAVGNLQENDVKKHIESLQMNSLQSQASTTFAECNIYHNDEQHYKFEAGGIKFILKRSIPTGFKPFKCETCGKEFIKNTLKKHEMIHNSKNYYKNNECGESFTRSNHLKANENINCKIKLYKCNTCERKFTYMYQLKVHENIHTGVKPYECNECGKKFTTRSSVKQHESIHTGVKPYECTICGKRFRQKNSLKEHKMIHSCVRYYKCNECGKRFTQNSSLKRHENIHKAVKSFGCNSCGKKFSLRHQLKKHEMIHTGIKPYECKTCGKEFLWKNSLQKHEIVHT